MDTQGIRLVSDPEPVDGGYVLYALDAARKLEAIGVDAADGKVRWHHPASPSFVPSGVGLRILAKDGVVVFMEPSGRDPRDGQARVTAVDAVTGDRRWTYSSGLEISSAPEWCDDDKKLCLVIDADDDGRALTVLDPARGTLLAAVPLDDGRQISEQLYPAAEATALTRVTTAGKRLWQRSIRELFGTASVSLDYGWHIIMSGGRYVGWLGATGKSTSTGTVRDLGREAMAGFDATTGRPLWTQPGTYTCRGIQFTIEHPVRCRAAARVVYRDGAEPALQGGITVEGFDPATGKTRWSWRAGPVPGLAFDHDSVRRIDDTTYVVETPTGPALIDVDSGQRPLSGEPPVSWCADTGEYTPVPAITTRRSNQLYVDVGPRADPAARRWPGPEQRRTSRAPAPVTCSPGPPRTASPRSRSADRPITGPRARCLRIRLVAFDDFAWSHWTTKALPATGRSQSALRTSAARSGRHTHNGVMSLHSECLAATDPGQPARRCMCRKRAERKLIRRLCF